MEGIGSAETRTISMLQCSRCTLCLFTLTWLCSRFCGHLSCYVSTKSRALPVASSSLKATTMPLSSWSCRKWVVPFGQSCVSLLFYIKSSLAFHLDASVRQDPAEALGAQKKLCHLSHTRKRIHGRVKWKRTRGEKLLSETKQDMTVAKDNLTLCGDSGPAYAGSSPAFQGTNAAPFCKPGSWMVEDVKQFDHQTANPLSWGGAGKVVFASLRVFFHLRIL